MIQTNPKTSLVSVIICIKNVPKRIIIKTKSLELEEMSFNKKSIYDEPWLIKKSRI